MNQKLKNICKKLMPTLYDSKIECNVPFEFLDSILSDFVFRAAGEVIVWQLSLNSTA